MSLPFANLQKYGRATNKIGEGGYGKILETNRGNVFKKIINDTDNVPTQSAIYDIVSLLKVDSPYVISLIDVDIGKSSTTIVLPRADGSLKDFITLPTLDIKRIITQLCLGVADIHNANLLHLDIKPENILLHDIIKGSIVGNLVVSPNLAMANVWVTDLGLSRIHTCAFPPLREGFFTIPYRSPEITLMGDVTAKGDVWATGVVLAELFLSRGQKDIVRLFNLTYFTEVELLRAIFKLLGSPQPGSYLTTLKDWNANYEGFPSTARDFFHDKGLTDEEIDIVLSFLVIDPYQRPSIFQILSHPWFGNNHTIPQELTCRQALLKYAHYPENKWEGRHWQYRMIVVDWLMEVKRKFRLKNSSIALGVYLLDRIQSLVGPIDKAEIQLYSCACLYLGSLLYEEDTHGLEEFVYVADRSFTLDQISLVIKRILTVTSFDVAVATSYFFLSDIILTQPDIAVIATGIWWGSLGTKSHFTNPQNVAEDVLLLADPLQDITPRAQILMDEILEIPVTYKNILTSNIREYLINRDQLADELSYLRITTNY